MGALALLYSNIAYRIKSSSVSKDTHLGVGVDVVG